VILAGALAFGLLAFIPRPHIILSNGRFSLSECDPSTSSRVVSATFTLTNTGHADGFVDVHLNVDGTSASMNEFGVQAGADCGAHTYSLRICVPPIRGYC